MPTQPRPYPPFAERPRARWAALAAIPFVVMACGGSADPEDTGEVASTTTTLQMSADTLAPEAAGLVAQPTFHIAPVVLEAPDDLDVHDANRSAQVVPKLQRVPDEFKALSTRRLTPYTLEEVHQKLARAALAAPTDEAAAPLAGTGVVTTYSVAQVRAAYGFGALPAVGSKPAGVQAAQLGAGQTVYVIGAKHNPNVAAELAVFNQKFGLPTCTAKVLPAATGLPLAPASPATGCELWVAYGTASGAIASTAPAYDAGWATEMALDVQWVHAIAPLARIVLIEAPDPSLNSLLGAIRLANAMGSGVVSMSFGAQEGAWTDSVDSAFSATGMTYLAATGDSGAGVNWPSVSPNVIAVGGTTLTYAGSGVRSEVSWSGTGGGASAFIAVPAYQKSSLRGTGSLVHRTVADVAMNADPTTGQYVAVMQPGSGAVQWISAGGTSLAAPMWAGLVAVATANRKLATLPVLAGGHAVLYGQIGAVASNYASGFADIRLGSHGACSTCSAGLGYDELTGLGTPNAGPLVSLLTGATAPVLAPVVTPASISGMVGSALTFTAAVNASNPVAFSLSGAPTGMSVSAAGVVSWPAPVAGSYAVTVVAKDTKTGLTGQGVYSVSVAAPVAPTVGSASIAGRPGVALAFKANVASANPLAYSLAGAPSGMVVAADGVMSWPKPVAGTYSVTLTARDTKTGLSGKGVFTVKIAAAGPVITASALVGVAGQLLSGSISVTSPGATWLSVSIAGVPLGMGFAVAGNTITASWPRPVAGSYQLLVTAKDSAGLSAQLAVPVTINLR
ncbi:putative Ig domain-containing protein [Acidovorax radicis]|uniref:S53 family peptidase n=1 Tax=Acidovorax radicis TaxID=758826 RepID=UPI001CF9FA2D|nr:S53 family peptidase [Acidovorax radicis]UCV01181.1 S8 family serine peptidase [Acidovorax radicis]